MSVSIREQKLYQFENAYQVWRVNLCLLNLLQRKISPSSLAAGKLSRNVSFSPGISYNNRSNFTMAFIIVLNQEDYLHHKCWNASDEQTVQNKSQKATKRQPQSNQKVSKTWKIKNNHLTLLHSPHKNCTCTETARQTIFPHVMQLLVNLLLSLLFFEAYPLPAILSTHCRQRPFFWFWAGAGVEAGAGVGAAMTGTLPLGYSTDRILFNTWDCRPTGEA